jgi:Flp pilus assembly protein TadG
MALSLPILFALIFGAFELGNYFMTEHKVVKAVRDGARYAARQPFTEYTGCAPSTTVIDETRNVTRTGQVASGGVPKVSSWTDPNSITVSATCDNSGTYTGIYVTSPEGTPVVTVVAIVPYTSILGQLGLANVALNLNARSEAAVTGI